MFSIQTAEDVVLGRPFHVVADKEIEQAIAVVIEPHGRGAESFALAQAARAGHIDKRSFAGIAEQPILSDARDENVREPVVVIVTDGYAHAVTFDFQAGARGHIGEGAVAVVAVELKSRAAPLVAGTVRAIDEHDVLPAVAIVVKKGAAGAEGFRQEFSTERAAVVLELNARLAGHVGESKAKWSG